MVPGGLSAADARARVGLAEGRARGLLARFGAPFWWRVWLAGIVALAFAGARGSERYAREYQTLPALDWIETLPALSQAASVPAAAELSRGLPTVVPGLLRTAGPDSFSPVFGPYGMFQRSIAGVREAAVTWFDLAPAAAGGEGPARVGFSVLVFHQSARARAWVDLYAFQPDFGRSEIGAPVYRTSGPDEPDRIWVAGPDQSGRRGGRALAAGSRGPVAYVVDVALSPAGLGPAESPLGSALAADGEVRRILHAWTAWLQAQPFARG